MPGQFGNPTGFRVEGGQFVEIGGNINHLTLVNTGSRAENEPVDSERPSAMAVTARTVPLPTRANCDIYYEHLSVKGHGSPLWFPAPSRGQSTEYRRRGIDIGDVGLITSSHSFDFLFNVLLPPDDPIHADQLPEDFPPFHPPLRSQDIDDFEDFGKNGYLASASVEKTQQWQDGVGSSSGLMFETTDSEGAILTMPYGSYSKNLRNTKSIKEYLAANAENWYRYVNDVCGREAKNGDLRLVTGCDKARAWGMATFSRSASTVQTSFQLSFKPRIEQAGQTYGWEGAEGRTGPSLDETAKLRSTNETEHTLFINQCLFIRTLTVSLQDDAWKRLEGLKSGVVDTKESRESRIAEDPHVKGKMRSSDNNLASAGGMPDNKLMENSLPHSSHLNTALPFHPATLLNAHLLRENPYAKIAITEDINWMSVLNEHDLSLPPADQILHRVMESHDVSTDKDVVWLTPKISYTIAGKRSMQERIEIPNNHSPMHFTRGASKRINNIETEKDAREFFEQMTEFIKQGAEREGQESLTSDISETLDMILKGYGSVPNSTDGLGNMSMVEPSTAREQSPMPDPIFDPFIDFSFGTIDDDDSKAPTPDLLASSSTNTSPESNHEADPSHHTLPSTSSSSELKTEDNTLDLRLGPWKVSYDQSTNEWKWDSPMSTSDQPWAIFNP